MKNFLSLVLLFICYTSNLYAIEKYEYGLIDEMIADGDMFRAVTKLKEMEYRDRPSAKGLSLGLKIVKLCAENNEFDLADATNDKMVEKYNQYLKSDYLIRKAEILYLSGNSTASQTITSSMGSTGSSSTVAYLSGYSLKGNLRLSLEDRLIHSKYMAKKKSKPLAIAISVVPGIGQMYVENMSSGLSSLFLNIFAIGISILAFQNNEIALGISSGIVGASFYATNFYAAAMLADRHNTSIENNFQQHLIKKYRSTLKVFSNIP